MFLSLSCLPCFFLFHVFHVSFSSARHAAVSNAAMQVILDKMYALSDMCVTQFVSKQAAFDNIRRGPSPALNPRAVPCASSLPSTAPHPAFPHCRASHVMQRAVRGVRRGSQPRDQDSQLKAAYCPLHP
jgi:hypothetical protein